MQEDFVPHSRRGSQIESHSTAHGDIQNPPGNRHCLWNSLSHALCRRRRNDDRGDVFRNEPVLWARPNAVERARQRDIIGSNRSLPFAVVVIFRRHHSEAPGASDHRRAHGDYYLRDSGIHSGLPAVRSMDAK